ncbi:GNAT family N-acetyltransferase [Streptomyces sp. NL15-2K]|uniref:GNAT family N-acetyltransferase n=1 Tax=Streptomyces sp. NL15-2K TaxID=376149 RepID=UPI00155AD238|nr:MULTISPECIES: GNAT family N-acetyltransferase [Actinomycetes]WKX09481.1 GNAT family N-acetyltransferase [Kutzneria buriramensis]
MVVEKVRGTGIARQIHDELLRDRTEERVTLLVDRVHPKVRALYESWGYEWFGEVLPFPEVPLYDALILRRGTG